MAKISFNLHRVKVKPIFRIFYGRRAESNPDHCNSKSTSESTELNPTESFVLCASHTSKSRIHRRDQHEFRGIGQRGADPGYGDFTFFNRLAQHFEYLAGELRQLVKK